MHTIKAVMAAAGLSEEWLLSALRIVHPAGLERTVFVFVSVPGLPAAPPK